MLQASTSANSLEELKRENVGAGITMKAPPFFLEMAESMGVDHKELWVVLKATAFKGAKDGDRVIPPTNEQMYALMLVANAYGLNPFTKEIYAFPDKQNGIVPVVGVDGWLRIANSNPMMDGYEMRASEKLVKMDDDAKECPEWIEGVVYRKDRNRPIVVREYLDECYRPAFQTKSGYKVTGPWQSHTKRMLRHKALIQAFRTAFGFAGVYEEDEAQRIIEAKVIDTTPMIEGTPEAPDTSEFDRLAAEVDSDPQWLRFLEETARANGMTVDGLKVEAGKDFEQFTGMFRAWAKKQAPARATHKPKSTEARIAAAEAAANGNGQAEPAAPVQGQEGAAPEPPASVVCPVESASDGEEATVYVTVCEKCPEKPNCPSWKG